VCAFLLDVSANQFRHPGALVWGAAADVPFRPRLARGDLVLAAARWTVERTDPLATVASPDLREFCAAVRDWATTWLVPRYVYLLEREGRLLLDLLSAPSLLLLRSALARMGAEPVVLEEALPSPDGRDGRPLIRDAAGNGYVSEIIVPLLARRPAPLESPARAVDLRVTSAARDGMRDGWPGGQWLSLHVYLPHAARDRVITNLLPDLRERLSRSHAISELFFVRYADPGDHLRIRIPLGRPGRKGVLDDVLAWAHDAADRVPVDEIAVREYRREVDRYGGPQLIGDAERLFCADSAAVSGILRDWSAVGRLPRTVLGAATMAAIGAILLPDPSERREFVANWNADTRPGADEYRVHGRLLWSAHTAYLHTTDLDVETEEGHEDAALRTLRSALRRIDAHWSDPGTAFASALDPVAHSDPPPGLSTDQHRHRVIASLLHMHANRIGLTRAEESVARGAWRRLLDRALTTGNTTAPSTGRPQ
jgi:thiopeptide-type bacteriocin biosynthesis protein